MSKKKRPEPKGPGPTDSTHTPGSFLEVVGRLRKLHTPGLRCFVLLRALDGHSSRLATGVDFSRDVFFPLWDGQFAGTGGDDVVAGFLDEPVPDDWTVSMEYKALNIAVAYCVEAIKADWAGEIGRAWDLAFDAAQWEAFLSGVLTGGRPDDVKDAMQNLGAKPWTLNKPERDDGFSGVLHATLKQALDAGKPRPTARQVLAQWVSEKPAALLGVTPIEAHYIDAEDKAQTASMENIRDRIRRMTTPKTGR